MIKRFFAVALLATSLAGCATTAGGPPPTVTDIIADVQKAAVAVCGFAPTGEVIAAIIGTVVPGGGAVVTAAAIGSAICAAFAPPKAFALKGGKRMVRGYVVTPGAVNGVPIR